MKKKPKPRKRAPNKTDALLKQLTNKIRTELDSTKKAVAQLTRRRAPGGGRKSNAERFGEPTIELHVRLPKSQVDLLDSLGPDRTTALVGIVRTSVQYRLEYGSEQENDG